MGVKWVDYLPGMQIVNIDQLPRGTGAKYLECLVDHLNLYCAVRWRRVWPAKLPRDHVLVCFGKGRRD